MRSETPLYGPQQSRFARYLEKREERRPDPVARELRRRLLAGLRGRVIGSGAATAARSSTVIWVLCSVPDPIAALRELRRVLVPGGELRFYEHVHSEQAVFRSLQRAVDSLFWTRALGGCHTTRDTAAAIAAAGFEILTLERGFHSSSVLTITSAPYVLGIARR